ncbi:MAG: CotH kinase family protein [Fibrobacter sp.]|nr:CotH kinase family protein [Fibrobacter sp.]
MVCRRFSQLCIIAALAVLSSCSDDNPTPDFMSPIADSSDSASTPASSSSSEERSLSFPFVGGPVMFTEVAPVNVAYKDHEGDDAGWVELFNASNDTVNLSGTYLTDTLAEPFKFAFGNVKIPPQSFMLVFLSGKSYPDFVAPHDSTNMIGPGCWTWTDAQSEPPGESYANPLDGQKKNCFKENGTSRFGAVMKFGENEELGWTSIAVFVGTGNANKEDVVDISNTNEILIHAYITKDRKVSFRLTQPNVDDWKGYEIVLTGTGDSSTVYRTTIPTGTTFPDLENIYGTRMSPEANEMQEVSVKVFSYVARNRGHEPHANFKLGKSGGSLYIINADSAIVDSIAYPDMPHGKSWNYGTSPDGTTGFGFAEPTPYGHTAAIIQSRSPSLDTLAEFPPSGLYSAPFAVTLPTNAAVRCEKGGAAPTANSPVTTSLQINGTTVLRCASFVAGAHPGDELTRTYIFEDAPAAPAIFVTADPNSLFSPDTGIYMEGDFAQAKEPHYGANYWLDKEIPVTVELLEKGVNKPAFAKKAGLKIFGNHSRQKDKKSVAITFREKYGDSRLKYTLFPEFPELKKFKVFILRNNGSNFENDYIRDRLASSVSEGLGVDYQRGRFAIVYYNGEYFGIHDIRERSTEYYFETHYGMDPNNIDLIKADNSVTAGSSVDYVALMEWLETHHLDSEENYAYVASQIDVDNYINYMHTELYANNRDWPANNIKKWRVTNPKTKWKWFLYDLDFGMGNDYSDYTNNIFEFAAAEDGEGWPNGPEHTLLLRRMLENEGFKAAFVNRMAVLLHMNFESSRVLARIEKMMAEIEAEIPRDQKRWGLSKSRMERQLNTIKDFAKTRPEIVYNELREYFKLGAATEMTLSASGPGTVTVHGLPLDSPTLTIPFFAGTPVTITAEASAGGVWAGWSDGVVEQTRTVLPGEIPSLTASFK